MAHSFPFTAAAAAIAACISTFAPPAHAACDSYAVTTPETAFTVDNSLSLAQLAERNGTGTLGFTAVTVQGKLDPNNCTASWSVTPLRVHVARELKPGTCGYQHVLNHELEHVAIYRNSNATARARLGRDLDLYQLHALVTAQHAAHDSPEEYELNTTACDGEIARIYHRATR